MPVTIHYMLIINLVPIYYDCPLCYYLFMISYPLIVAMIIHMFPILFVIMVVIYVYVCNIYMFPIIIIIVHYYYYHIGLSWSSSLLSCHLSPFFSISMLMCRSRIAHRSGVQVGGCVDGRRHLANGHLAHQVGICWVRQFQWLYNRICVG